MGPTSRVLEEIRERDQLRDIVVADDDPTLLSVISDVFTEECHTVHTAADGLAALTAIHNRMPDVLLSDLNMPRMSGFELLSIVRRRFPEIKVIAMSGGYSGSTTPPGVAVDGFYAKGSVSVFRLLDLLQNIEGEDARSPARRGSHVDIRPGTLSQSFANR